MIVLARNLHSLKGDFPATRGYQLLSFQLIWLWLLARITLRWTFLTIIPTHRGLTESLRLQQLSTGAINVPDKNDERRLSKQVQGCGAVVYGRY